MRVSPGEYQRLELRAHTLLSGVPLHDAWAVDLPRAGGRTIADVRALVSEERLSEANAAVRLLFGLRWKLGSLFGWDVAPDGSKARFRDMFVSDTEAISEICNATVHGFSVLALRERPEGYRLYWGIYVRPVGRFTAWYMRLIDPFRRLIIYPALLRLVHAAWVNPDRGRPVAPAA